MQRFFLILFFVMILPVVALADPPAGLGGVATSLMEPISVLGDFFNTIALVTGVSFIFAAFFKYMQHRRNPLATPISTVVWLLILGVMLLSLPLAYKLAYEVPPTIH